MTNEPVQGNAPGARAHARHQTEQVSSLACRRRRVAVVGTGSGGPTRVTPSAERRHDVPQARYEAEALSSSVRRRGSAPVSGAGPGGPARVAPAAERGDDVPQARHEIGPAFSLACRRRRVAVVGTGSGGPTRVTPAAEREHDAPLAQTVGDKRWATLRRGTASPTETVGRAPFELDGRRAGEGAR
ncbi:DUF6380 family protein [Streptomyces sp. DH10]|uniref:DUF6380 family protein n=1 Tax=Streptomyces sp. DH10 TaxID=3040121 RepID=UPI0024418A4F|nr:DUF6380 family protein [Streptomyces sp. DH10]MDG9708695.1 hypothetical protein [Streptomyces sp. DH10]